MLRLTHGKIYHEFFSIQIYNQVKISTNQICKFLLCAKRWGERYKNLQKRQNINKKEGKKWTMKWL